MRTIRTLGIIAILALAFAAGATAASYQIQPILRLGDTIGDMRVQPDGHLWVGTLNDRSQIAFNALIDRKGGTVYRAGALFQYSEGLFTPIRVDRQDGPIGGWASPAAGAPVSMDPSGNVLFAAAAIRRENGPFRPGKTTTGVFLWDYRRQQSAPVVVGEVPGPDATSLVPSPMWQPSINGRGEMAFVAQVTNAPGSPRSGIFFRGQNGQIQSVAVPGAQLPGGGRAIDAHEYSFNDAGVVAFTAQRQGAPGAPTPEHVDPKGMRGGYVWENGEITPVAIVGTQVPGGGTIATVKGVWLNNRSRNVLICAQLDEIVKGPAGLYLWSPDGLTTVVETGEVMPGGGKFARIAGSITVSPFPTGVSSANGAGQHAFLARLQDGKTAAYQLDVDGNLSLIMKDGEVTSLGAVTLPREFPGIGFNTQGRVALVAQFDRSRPTLVLMTPTSR